jgi:hypothetical protein
MGTGSLLLGESIERFRKTLVNIVKTATLDSFQRPSFKLGLADFDVHCGPLSIIVAHCRSRHA